MTIQILQYKGMFDICDNADEVIRDYLLVQDNERRTLELEEVNDNDVFY